MKDLCRTDPPKETCATYCRSCRFSTAPTRQQYLLHSKLALKHLVSRKRGSAICPVTSYACIVFLRPNSLHFFILSFTGLSRVYTVTTGNRKKIFFIKYFSSLPSSGEVPSICLTIDVNVFIYGSRAGDNTTDRNKTEAGFQTQRGCSNPQLTLFKNMLKKKTKIVVDRTLTTDAKSQTFTEHFFT